MSIGSIRSLIWTGGGGWGDGEDRGTLSKSESKGSSLGETIKSSKSDFAFGIGPDQISVSTIVEKLVTERLKLGIVKTVKPDPIFYAELSTDIEKDTKEDSSEETIPSLTLCLEKAEGKWSKAFWVTQDGQEPDENPHNVIEPKFSESEDETDVKYRDPNKDIQMMLNRSRSFYTPAGFKDSRFELKKLEQEREKMWTQSGRDTYTLFLYEEALKQLSQHIKIKGKVYEDEDSELYLRGDAVVKSIESIMQCVKPKELPPDEWDYRYFANDKNAPYWATAPSSAVDKTINKIRYIYKILKETDFHRQDPKMRRKTGRKMHKEEEIEESEESVTALSEEESSEDEPYLLRRKESVFIKKKVPEIVEETEEIQVPEIRPGMHNIQVGHELSISTLQKIYPESPQSSESEKDEEEVVREIPVVAEQVVPRDTQITTSTQVTKRRPPKSSWIKRDDLDESSSEESLYSFGKGANENVKARKVYTKPFISMHKGFPTIRQRPQWITLTRDCLEKECEDYSTVERYKCLCLNRGLPPLECIARNIKKKSAKFNRMGRGPEDTIQILSEVLGRQTKRIDLTGVYMSKNDICHLGKALPNFQHLSRLRLPRTKLTGDKLLMLIKSLVNSEELCLLDVSYNNLKKITSAMSKTLTAVMTLCTLNLKHCQLGNDSFTGLSHLSGSITSLDISWNKLNEPSGLKTLLNAFIKNKSQMRELRLSWNSIAGVESAKILADIGKNLKDLVFYDISYNGLASPEELSPFNSMILECRRLKAFLLAGNPLGAGAAEALLKDLAWTGKPALRLLDLGDLWIDKDTYQLCKGYKLQYDVEVRVGGVKGNINLLELDMSIPYLKRLHFLNTSKKKKKTLKDLGNSIRKLMEKEEVTRVRAARFKSLLTEDKFKLEEGLPEALAKSLSDRHRMINLQNVYNKYRDLYPEEIKEQKKKKPKKKKEQEIDEPIIELMETKLETKKSKPNLLFDMATKEAYT